ncbi:MAG: hypothetical protein MZV63_40005 [Marinilabiliales bacterium]|nr:hypothetical protein [Marinilabiliales bacterium]
MKTREKYREVAEVISIAKRFVRNDVIGFVAVAAGNVLISPRCPGGNHIVSFVGFKEPGF